MGLREFLSKWSRSFVYPIAIRWVSDAGADVDSGHRIIDTFGILENSAITFDRNTFYGNRIRVKDIERSEEIRTIYLQRSLTNKLILHVYSDLL